MAAVLLKTENLTKVFNPNRVPVHALRGISLTIHEGEFVAISGKSGCGKSTLLSILGLLDTPTSGQYQLCGADLAQLSGYQQAALRNRHIGWVFQNFNLINDMTVAENVMLPLKYNQAWPKSTYTERVNKVLNDVGLDDKAGAYPSELSGGQQQRVAIARALITEPDILLADEPTGNLDSQTEQAIFSLLSDLHRRGVTILLVTHSRNLAQQCQRILTISDGALVDAE